MSSERLRENLDAIAEAAGGVSRLRELILQLAVQGKLVEQEPKDDPVFLTLLNEVSGSRRKYQTVEADSESVFEIPSAWRWARLAQLVERTDYGTSVKSEAPSNAVPVLRMGNIQNGEVLMENLKYVPQDMEGLPELYLNQGDLLFNRTNSYELVGKTGIYRGEPASVTFASYLIRIRPNKFVDSDFLNHAMNSPYYRVTQIEPEITQQTGQANFNGSKMLSTIIPIAPLAEQKRIVAKVDELMALCDELEQKQEQRHTVRRAAHTSALEALTNAQTPDELAHAWERMQKHWDVLAAHADAVPPLRQAILQLAEHGHLLPQDATEEPANRWLAQQGVVVRNDAQAQHGPVGWVFAALGELGEFFGGGTPSKGISRYWEGDIPWVSPKDMKRLRIGESIDTISQEAVAETAVKMIPSGALLMVVRGMILAHSFPVAITTRDLTVNQDMKALVLKPTAFADYLLLALRGNKAKVLAMVERSTHGTCRLDSSDLARLRIGIPPLAEQKRIVARVDELMALCDSLEQRAREQETLASQLAHAAVATVATG